MALKYVCSEIDILYKVKVGSMHVVCSLFFVVTNSLVQQLIVTHMLF